jgi:hypothetical protein
MTVASEITKSQTNLSNSYTACQNKGATMPQAQNFDNLATCIDSIPTGSSGKYQLLERIKDDNNNEIGTVSGFFTDANDIEYAVVCLDAQYRNSSTQWISTGSTVTNLPVYNYSTWGPWSTQETATSNCDLILAYCNANNYTSTALSHCRSQSFVIGGITYYGQIPNAVELQGIANNWIEITNADTSLSNYPTLKLKNSIIWSSNQTSSTYAWYLTDDARFANYLKTNNYMACPILEIPNSNVNYVNWNFDVGTWSGVTGTITINDEVHNADDGDFVFKAIIGQEYTITLQSSDYYIFYRNGYPVATPYTERADSDVTFYCSFTE